MLLLRPEDTAGLLTMATLGLEIRPMEHPEPVVRAAEVLIIATNTNVPVLDGAWLSPGAHVTSIVGSNVGLVRSGLIKQKRRSERKMDGAHRGAPDHAFQEQCGPGDRRRGAGGQGLRAGPGEGGRA